MQPLILITNDDGIHAPGLAALAHTLARIGKTVIVAPDRDNSAASHSLTMTRPLRVKEIAPDHYAIDGTPTDCVTIGIGKILTEKPLLVVSGINPGPNLGDDISYSGTVSAGVEGTMLGIPSLAVSLAGEGPYHFETAASFAAELARTVLERGLPKDTLLNVNVPNLLPGQIKGIRFTRQGRRLYDDAIKETFDPWGKKHYWIGGGTPNWDTGDDTDAQAILAQCISITPLHLDLTNHAALKKLRTWQLNIGG
ncbi:MAG: 5'/3'-nucleotidase SurE [Desulfobulbaceae bacterium]|nr:5'/3'-nucleotidase SurE [Desulfobulbaceae bacterium]HIJ79010.1 5'/3'-nucleotidase SurE [Deltaproteobacteria bacterium]